LDALAACRTERPFFHRERRGTSVHGYTFVPTVLAGYTMETDRRLRFSFKGQCANGAASPYVAPKVTRIDRARARKFAAVRGIAF
jgi:hypothetical protein